MRRHIKKGLMDLAKDLPTRDTAIKGFFTVVGDKRIYHGKKLSSGKVRESVYKRGLKPVNNYRSLKKAYNRGGINEVNRLIDHLSKKKLGNDW